MSLKHLVDALNDVLFDEWDPLGVRAVSPTWPRDEYHDYVPRILSLLDARSTDKRLAEHLAALETGPMGINATPLAHRLAVASRLRDVARQFASHPRAS